MIGKQGVPEQHDTCGGSMHTMHDPSAQRDVVDAHGVVFLMRLTHGVSAQHDMQGCTPCTWTVLHLFFLCLRSPLHSHGGGQLVWNLVRESAFGTMLSGDFLPLGARACVDLCIC